MVFLHGMCKNMSIFKQVQISSSGFAELRIVNTSCWGWELGFIFLVSDLLLPYFLLCCHYSFIFNSSHQCVAYNMDICEFR